MAITAIFHPHFAGTFITHAERHFTHIFTIIIWLKRKTLKGISIYISMPSAMEIYIDRLVNQHKNAIKMLEK